MAELAVSCEYLTSDKSCLAVSESAKAKAARQVRCENYEKMSCCYVCLFKRKCTIGCTYLGNFENEPQQIRGEKIEADETIPKVEKTAPPDSEKAPAVNCSSCNIEMHKSKTKIRIDRSEDSGEKVAEESMPVIVYTCTKCGKIELVAEEETKLRLSKTLKT